MRCHEKNRTKVTKEPYNGNKLSTIMIYFLSTFMVDNDAGNRKHCVDYEMFVFLFFVPIEANLRICFSHLSSAPDHR